MKFFLFTILCFSISNTFFSQLNIQSGYDMGYYNITLDDEYDLSKKRRLHLLHRLNLKVEYLLKSNFLIGVNTGIDIHNYQHEYTLSHEGNNYTEIKEVSMNESIISANRIGLSIGYQHPITNTSSLSLMVNYDQFFISRIKNKESLFIKEYYSISETEDKYLAVRSEKYATMIDLEEIGYYQKLNLKNRHLIFSIGYRYNLSDVFISSSLKFSPFNRRFVDPVFIIPNGNQNIFFFGFKIGYTFPQKDKNDEK